MVGIQSWFDTALTFWNCTRHISLLHYSLCMNCCYIIGTRTILWLYSSLFVQGYFHYIIRFSNSLNITPRWSSFHGSLARYVTLRVVHASGMPGTFSTPLRVGDPDMYHGTCITQVHALKGQLYCGCILLLVVLMLVNNYAYYLIISIPLLLTQCDLSWNWNHR